MIDWPSVRYFTRDEFRYHADVEPDPALVRMLDNARGIAGIAFVINSGIRSPERNAEVGGVLESPHLSGHAVDIRVRNGAERFAIVAALLACGARRIGVARTFVHVDTDPGKPQEVLWLYS